MTRMQGFKLFFAGFLGIMAFGPTWGDDGLDVARAAARRGTVQNSTVTNTQTVRQKTTGTGAVAAAVSNRITNAAGHANVQKTTKGTVNTSGVTRNLSGTRGVVSTRGAETNATRNAVGRSVVGTHVVGRTGNQINSNTRNTPISRTAIVPVSTTKTTGVVRTSNNITNTSRNAANLGAITSAASKRGEKNGGARAARSATTSAQVLSADDVKNRKYSKCQTVYNECMDEFCANKDTQLKRCACSARKDEFNSVKRRLGVVEDKLLSFNQRLLTVNMSPEDVQAMTQATEGENGFYGTKDTSESQSILNQISKKLNKNFKTNDFDTNLNSISLTLDTDAAFDSVDSLQGAATTSKTGVELYRAALPVCREMAAEVCSDMDLSLAESGYQMLIEQDCNIVSKGYQSQADQAREQVFDSSALLDMARLDVRQTQNSDDKLTCKKKMLDMLTDSTVCGANLGQCLDVTGQYINPTTGQAVLSVNLKNMVTLIESPKSVDEKWRDVTKNKAFVDFLNDKKKYLSAAMENCQDVADDVWYDFIEDALAQIKLAQRQKLDVMQQGCTALTTQCLADADQSIENFDTRALSVFGVVADKTSREFCNEITVSCAALIEAMNKEQENNTLQWKKNDSDEVDLKEAVDDDSWVGGMTQIAVDKTFNQIIDACTEIGKNCIIDVCRSINGNFGLCENIETSINRKSVINRDACWQQVMDCVDNAGSDAISAVIKRLQQKNTPADDVEELFRKMNYDNWEKTCVYNDGSSSDNITPSPTKSPTDAGCINDLCLDTCGDENNIDECKKCRLTEYIWGNCNFAPRNTVEYDNKNYNQIVKPKDGVETLLWWFAKNTGTADVSDSCRDTQCRVGFELAYTCSASLVDKCASNGADTAWECKNSAFISVSGRFCGDAKGAVYDVVKGVKNCCPSYNRDGWGNCWYGGIEDEYDNTVKEISKNKEDATFSDDAADDENGTVRIFTPNTDSKVSIIARWKKTNDDNNSAIVNSKEYYRLETDGGSEAKDDNDEYMLVCVNSSGVAQDTKGYSYPNGQKMKCDGGRFVILNLNTGYYFVPTQRTDEKNGFVTEIDANSKSISHESSGKWNDDTKPNSWIVQY
ncbi:MAG: hypothetical protein MJ187_04815 [Alphaproteobacteria bacterium]|nr:hypothetical protein [Alphaproteobacteria bacterium]